MNAVRRERKIQYVVKSFEKCHPPSASDLAKSIRIGRVGNGTCVLCLCGESLLMLSETITLKDAYTDTKLILRDLIQELNLTPAVSLLSVNLNYPSSQKVCKTCVNRLSSFYLFTNKCSKTAKAFKNIERLVYNDEVNSKKSRKKRRNKLLLPYKDIYKYVNDSSEDSSIECKDKTASYLEGAPNGHRGCSDCTCKKYCATEKGTSENLEQTNNLQSKEAEKPTFECNSCDERNTPWNTYIEHQELHSYESVVQNFARNKQFCICCLKGSHSLVKLSEEMIFKGLNMSASYQITLNEMISEVFHVSVMKEYHPALICEACIDRTVNTYSFLKMLECSLFILNKFVVDIDSSLKKAVGNLNYIHSPVHLYLDTRKYLKTKIENTTELNSNKVKIDSNSRTACYNSEVDVNSDNDAGLELLDTMTDIAVTKNKYKYTRSEETFSTLKIFFQHTCEFCNKKFSSMKRLLSHSKRNHDTNIACESTKKISNTLRNVDKTTVICECCNKIFPSKSLIKVHILNKNNAREDCFASCTSPCDICGEKFASKEMLRRHRDSTHKRLTQCPLCNKVVKDQHLLEKHIRDCETKDKPFKCDMCDAHFTSEDKMTFHRRKHFPRNFNCKFCPGKYWTKSELNGHIKRSHKDVLTGTNLGRVYPCTMCTLDFSSKKERIIHMGLHPVDSKHICRICGESFKSKINYYGHLKRHNIKKDCECSVCGKFYTKYNIGNHMKSHGLKEDSAHVPDFETGKNETKIKTTMCDVCGRLLSNQASLMKHREIHKEQEQCPYCLKFVNSTIFDRHMKSHDSALNSKVRKNVRRNRKLFSCSKCDYTSMFADCLEAHENRFHLQVRPFKCDVCNKGFYAKITLKEHIKTHSGTKPEQCEQCGNRFVSKKALRLHVRIHTGEKPYKCDLCEEKFLSASRRQAHRTRKHFEPSVQCHICLKMYYTQSAVRIHIRDYHSAEPRQRSVKKRRV